MPDSQHLAEPGILSSLQCLAAGGGCEESKDGPQWPKPVSRGSPWTQNQGPGDPAAERDTAFTSVKNPLLWNSVLNLGSCMLMQRPLFSEVPNKALIDTFKIY